MAVFLVKPTARLALGCRVAGCELHSWLHFAFRHVGNINKTYIGGTMVYQYEINVRPHSTTGIVLGIIKRPTLI